MPEDTKQKRPYRRREHADAQAAGSGEFSDAVLRKFLKQGASLHAKSRLAEAAQAYRMALARAPLHHVALNNLAVVDLERGELAEAVRGFRAVLALRPDANKARANLALALHASGTTPEAIETYREVLQRDPENRAVRSMLGMLLLWSGDFSAFSWDCYAVRKLLEVERAAAFPFPSWDGSDLRGCSILVFGHDGLGDEINFASCVPDLLAQGARVSLACNARLVELFRRSFPAAQVHDLQAETEALRRLPQDFQAPLGRLARYLRLNREAFGKGGPYLKADPARTAAWRSRLGQLGPGPKIALSWRGGNPLTSGKARSIPLADWGEVLAMPGVHWISLQYGDCAAEIAAAEAQFGVRIHHWPDAIDDFCECAALLMALDDVVTVTTTLAHLCGALGRETRVLVNSRPHWRWQAEGERMPWFASLRLYRQAVGAGWREVLQRLAADLRQGTGDA